MVRTTLSLCLATLIGGALWGCEKDAAPQPKCYSGKVVATTCMMGILIDVDPVYPIGAPATLMPSNRFVGNNVIAVANPADLRNLNQPGQQLHFTYTVATAPSPMACLAADGPTTPVPIMTLSNISTTDCDSASTK